MNAQEFLDKHKETVDESHNWQLVAYGVRLMGEPLEQWHAPAREKLLVLEALIDEWQDRLYRIEEQEKEALRVRGVLPVAVGAAGGEK